MDHQEKNAAMMPPNIWAKASSSNNDMTLTESGSPFSKIVPGESQK